MAHSLVNVQAISRSEPSTPSWFGEVVLIVEYLRRRACLGLHRQRLEIQVKPALPRRSASSPATISRAERAHYRLSWAERLARNARTDQADQITLTLFGIPERVATFLGLPAT